MKEIPTVWVVQDNDYTITTAQEYGVLRFITEADFQVPGDKNEAQVQRDVSQFISEYRNERDYVLLVGNPMVIGYVMAEIRQCCPGELSRFLKWDKRVQRYLEYPLAL